MLMFFSHATAAKGLALTTLSCTSTLILLAPNSLSSAASDSSGLVADITAIIGLMLAFIGWLDIIYQDLFRQVLIPSLRVKTRHLFCVLLYSAIAAMYAILAFVAMDINVHSSWILIADYLLVAVFCAVLTIAIAHEKRS